MCIRDRRYTVPIPGVRTTSCSNFVVTLGRPDIAYSVALLSSFLRNPKVVHLDAAYRVLKPLVTRVSLRTSKAGTKLQMKINSYPSHGNTSTLPYLTYICVCYYSWWRRHHLLIQTNPLSSTAAEHFAARTTLLNITRLIFAIYGTLIAKIREIVNKKIAPKTKQQQSSPKYFLKYNLITWKHLITHHHCKD